MKINHSGAAAILFLFCLAIFALVFTTQVWMTDSAGNVDTKASITAPPK